MVKTKSQAKKPQKRGVDFKKVKRKIGRKLPPPQNSTNTEIKSKAIVLPEQTIVSERAGLAVNKRGLTLKELLQQTSHYNAKVRKEALLGVKDILLKHPAELKLHKIAVIEKLRERIGDDDKLVRETLYQLFKSVIFPGCGKDNQGPLVSLMMAYIFNAMTHLAIDVRLMAFKFFDLVVQFYPYSFSLHAEKILQNYEDILRKNQLLADKSKLKSTLAGLIHCLSLLPCNTRKDQLTVEKKLADHDILLGFEPEVAREPVGFTHISKNLKNLLPILVGSFLDFMPSVQNIVQLDAQSYDCMQLILQGIDLLVRYLVRGICGSQPVSQSPPSCQRLDLTAYHQVVATVKKLWDVFPLNLAHCSSFKGDERIFMLNTVITKIYLQLSLWDHSPSASLEKFIEFIESSLSAKIQSSKVFLEKHILPLITYIPKLAMQISGDWRCRVLQAFTKAFKFSNPQSSLKLACISAIEEMLAPENSWLYIDENDARLEDYQISWIHELPTLLILLDNKNPLCSKAVLHLQLRLGQFCALSSPFSQDFDSLQLSFRGFFSIQTDEAVCYGPFMRLSADIQELAVSCLYYFSSMDSLLLQSLVSCCLCNDIEPHLIFRISEVLCSAFRDGHIRVADYMSFHITLLSKFQVYPENISSGVEYDGKSNQGVFTSVTRTVCSCLSLIGDDFLVYKILERIVVDQICSKTSMDNKCAFLRLLVTLDAETTRLSDQSIIDIGFALPSYFVDIISNVEEDEHEFSSATTAKRRRYYMIPSFYLFHRSNRLLKEVLNVMGSWVSDINSSHRPDYLHPSSDRSSRICAVVSAVLHMHRDVKIRHIFSSCKTEVETLLHNLLNLLISQGTDLTLEERHKIQTSYNRLQAIMGNNEVVGN